METAARFTGVQKNSMRNFGQRDFLLTVFAAGSSPVLLAQAQFGIFEKNFFMEMCT